MADFREAMQNLGIDETMIPAKWETYYIAALSKYANQEGNKSRYLLPWFRQINKWLGLNVSQLDVLTKVGIRINQNESLYEWSSFARYILYDTHILEHDERILVHLIPSKGLGEFTGMFVLMSFLAGFDRSLNLYRRKGVIDTYLSEVFGIVGVLLDEYQERNDMWGTPLSIYLPRLANAELFVFDEVAFDMSQARFPGDIYRNKRTGEQVMITNAGQIYDETGQRLSNEKEIEIKEIPDSTRLAISDEDVQEDAEISEITYVQTLPEGFWESIFYETENGSLVGNFFADNGLAIKTPRVFENKIWVKVLDRDDYILNIYLPKYDSVDYETLVAACIKAWHYFSDVSDDDESLHEQMTKIEDNHYIQDLISVSDGHEIMKMSRTVSKKFTPKGFVYEGSLLTPGLIDYLDIGSDTSQFIELFRKYSLPANRDRALVQIFGLSVLREPVVMWSENNQTQKSFKNMVFDDKAVNAAGGFFYPEKLISMLTAIAAWLIPNVSEGIS